MAADVRRVATRYDKLAANFLSAAMLEAAVALWLWLSLNPNHHAQTGLV